MGTEACKCNVTHQIGQIKVDAHSGQKQYVVIEKISPSQAVCASWLKNTKRYGLQNNKGAFYGEIINGLPNGFGRLLSGNGTFYEGEFFNGAAHTQNGLYIYIDGSYYFGEIRNNKAEGKGIFVYKSKGDLVYEGQWLNDMPHGFGIQKLIDNSKYEGDFSLGIKQGNGIFTWPNGDRYKGQFKSGMICGQGTFQSATTGYRYVGQWSNNMKQGSGRQYFSDGKVIQCKFKQGNRVGPIIVTVNGTKIQGIQSQGRFVAN